MEMKLYIYFIRFILSFFFFFFLNIDAESI